MKLKFDAKTHTYTLGRKKLKSVTTLISEWQYPFEQKKIAKRVAAKKAKTVRSVIDEWEEKGRIAREKGTKVHSYIADRLDNAMMSNYSTPITIDEHFSEMRGFDSFWNKAKKQLQPAFIEHIIGDYDLGLGGTIDAIFWNNNNQCYELYDWKTGKFEFENIWQNFKAPFEDLEDCHINRYSLQLSIYKLLVMRQMDLKVGNSYIVHLAKNGEWNRYQVVDFVDRLKEIL